MVVSSVGGGEIAEGAILDIIICRYGCEFEVVVGLKKISRFCCDGGVRGGKIDLIV